MGKKPDPTPAPEVQTMTTEQNEIRFRGGLELPESYAFKVVVVTGPIIGLVTHNSARLVVELNKDFALTCTVSSLDGPQVCQVIKHLKAFKPEVFEMKGLDPDTDYAATFNVIVPGITDCVFRTHPDRDGERSFAGDGLINFVCLAGTSAPYCQSQVKAQRDLWVDALDVTRRHRHSRVLHVGNVACPVDPHFTVDKSGERKYDPTKAEDDVFVEKLLEVQGLAAADLEAKFEDTVEAFRQVYRYAFNRSAAKKFLACTSNIFLPGNFDLYETLAEGPLLSQQREHYVAVCAYEAFCEYCMNCWMDYPRATTWNDVINNARMFGHIEFGDVALVVVDPLVTAGLATKPIGEHALLGDEQWAYLTDLFGEAALNKPNEGAQKPNEGEEAGEDEEPQLPPAKMVSTDPATAQKMNGRLADSKVVLVLSTAGITDWKSCYNPWTRDEVLPETEQLLSTLFNWRYQDPESRELAIVSRCEGFGGGADVWDKRPEAKGYKHKFVKEHFVGPAGMGTNKRVLAAATYTLPSCVCSRPTAKINNFKISTHGLTTLRNYSTIRTLSKPIKEGCKDSGRTQAAIEFRCVSIGEGDLSRTVNQNHRSDISG
eukprot:GHVU01082993.1.p1 GENE.GHVU01082993.1~~GHVU01082993.1.p1  ORF type:complete len:601 (+),score=131.04 GHVU01082993.1:224-2026(+)